MRCVLCFMPQFALALATVAVQDFLFAGSRAPLPPPPHASYSLVRGPSPPGPSSPGRPSPLAESSLLSPCSQTTEACCAFKESRLPAVTHFWLSARKIAPARLRRKPTTFLLCVGLLSTSPPSLLSFQDLNANGGLKPVDTFGFRSLVRPPPCTETFLPPSFSGFLFKHGRGGAVESPPPPTPFLRHP